jgi:hypothetical protein
LEETDIAKDIDRIQTAIVKFLGKRIRYATFQKAPYCKSRKRRKIERKKIAKQLA